MLQTFYMYQVYVMVLIGLLYPISNIDLSFTLLLAAIGYFTVVFAKEKDRSKVIVAVSAVLAIANWFIQPDILSFLLVSVFDVLLMVSYYRPNWTKRIQPVILIVTIIGVILVSYALNFFLKTHPSIDVVYNSLLAFFVVGLFASAVYNMDVFYKLSFVNVLDDSSRQMIENIVLAISVIALIFHRSLFNLAVEALLLLGLLVLYLLTFLLRGSIGLFGSGLNLLGRLFPDLFKPGQLDNMIEKLNQITMTFDETTETISRHAGKSNVDILAKMVLFLMVAGLIIFVILMIRARREKEMVIPASGTLSIKSSINVEARRSRKRNRRDYGRLTEIRRKYKRTVKKLIRKHYEFPEHITANEYLTTISDQDVASNNFAELTGQYNEDRYGNF